MADVEFQVVGKVAHVRLNRESGMNAITGEMDELLYAAWQRINAEADIWCAILSATGEKAFCIGADVSEGPERKTRMARAGGLTGIGGQLVTLKKPLIPAVHDRKSVVEGKSVSVRVELGGRRIIKKNI